METINGSVTYFDYKFDIVKQSDSDTIFNINAEIDQFENFDETWTVKLYLYN